MSFLTPSVICLRLSSSVVDICVCSDGYFSCGLILKSCLCISFILSLISFSRQVPLKQLNSILSFLSVSSSTAGPINAGPNFVLIKMGSFSLPKTTSLVTHVCACLALIMTSMSGLSNSANLTDDKCGYLSVSLLFGGFSFSPVSDLATNAFSTFRVNVWFKFLISNDVIFLFALLAASNVFRVKVTVSVSALSFLTILSLIAQQFAPLSSKAYVGSYLFFILTRIGTIGLWAPGPTYAAASHLF